MQTKHCTECDKIKPATREFFYRQKNGKYKLASRCKMCRYTEEIKERTKRRRVEQKRLDDEVWRKIREPDLEEQRQLKRIINSCRRRMKSALSGVSKSDSTKRLLGCTGVYLREYLKSQFTDGMSWENYGLYGWHIDHIRPCASFDLTNPVQQRKCFHYTNLQPLWAIDNLQKADKWDGRKPS
jgi:hypothetical protein